MKAFIDESGTIRVRNYKRTKGYQNVKRSEKALGKRTDKGKKHKIQHNELG